MGTGSSGMLKEMALAVASVALLTGCADKCKQQLEDAQFRVDDLEAQLRANQEELDAKTAQLAQCQADLAGAQSQVGQLRQQMAAQPKLPEGWQAKKGMVMTSLPVAVLFDSGKAKLKAGAAAKLNKVISQIRSNWPGKDVYVVGHTDSAPIRKSKWHDNLELSLQRAAAVTRYLIKKGLNPKKIVAAGCGEHRPVASNATKSGMARNRRVEFWILKPL